MIENCRDAEGIDWIARFMVPEGAPELAVDFLNAASKLNDLLPHNSEFDETMGKLLEARDIALRVLSYGART